MKKLFTILIAISLTASLFAQSPEKMSYQAVIRNSNNALIQNTNIGMQISILQGSPNGTAVYVETQTPATNANGLVSIEIGAGTVVSGDFSAIDWSIGPYFIKTETDPTGGTNYTITGTSQLLSVPYALYANKAGSAQGIGPTVIQNDSLVLKDDRGVTRMVLNPNSGTFKMMNNDTTWYELQVASPRKEKMWNYDETYTVYDGGWYKTYTKDNKLVKEEQVFKSPYTSEGGRNLEERTVIYYDNAGDKMYKSTESYWEYPLSDDKQITKKKSCFIDNKEILTEETKEIIKAATKDVYKTIRTVKHKEDGGSHTINEEYKNGVLVKKATYESMWNNETKTYESIYSVFDPETGKTKIEKTFYDKQGFKQTVITEEDDFLKSTSKKTISNETTNKSFATEISNDGFLLTSSNSNSSLLITHPPSPDAKPWWKIDLLSDYGNNPYIAFSNDENGGYVSFGGESFGIKSDYAFASKDFDVYGNSTISGKLDVGGNTKINGSLNVSGTKNFRIDHPFDPENKYLYHSCVESNEVLNIYSGNVTTDDNGNAIVTLPDYFEAINTNYRYQLTVIGDFAQAIISKEIANGKFEIKTDKPNIKVSWQVTANRNDEYMQKNPFKDVRAKTEEDK